MTTHVASKCKHHWAPYASEIAEGWGPVMVASLGGPVHREPRRPHAAREGLCCYSPMAAAAAAQPASVSASNRAR